jgi:hypothetical protein
MRRWGVTRKVSDRRLVRPYPARRASGIGNWDQPKPTTCRGRLIWENPTYSAFWSVFGVTCLRLQRLAASVGSRRTSRLAPRKNLPDSGINSEPGGCYATPAQLNGSAVQERGPQISDRSPGKVRGSSRFIYV